MFLFSVCICRGTHFRYRRAGPGRACQVAQREKPTAAKWNCSRKKSKKQNLESAGWFLKEVSADESFCLGFPCLCDLCISGLNTFQVPDTLFPVRGQHSDAAVVKTPPLSNHFCPCWLQNWIPQKSFLSSLTKLRAPSLFHTVLEIKDGEESGLLSLLSRCSRGWLCRSARWRNFSKNSF